jgi:MFS superfamily sulfate permease-like transporter
VLVPKLVTTLKTYDRAQFTADLGAGVIVGIVALPLAIAFGIASGVTPERGLYTAIIAGFLISTLGGSRVQIGGPTGAFVVIVYGIVQQYGIDGLLVATLMGGVIQTFGKGGRQLGQTRASDLAPLGKVYSYRGVLKTCLDLLEADHAGVYPSDAPITDLFS